MATQATGLERFDLGRVIQRGFDAFGRQAILFLVIALVLVGIPAFVMQILFAQSVAAGDLAAIFSMSTVLMFLIMFLAGYALQAAVVQAAIRTLSDEPVDIATNLLFALKMLLPVIGVSIVVGFLAMIGFLLLIVPGIMFLIASSVAVPVLVEERLGVIASIKRSLELTRGSRWWILLLFIIIFLAAGMISGVRAAAFPGGLGIVAAVFEALFSAISSLVSGIFLASLYLELRLIKDGVGAQGLAAIFE
jgi:hypothetical protein